MRFASTMPRAMVYLTGANRWLELDDYPAPKTEALHLFLSSAGKANTSAGDGQLVRRAPSRDTPDRYVFDPKNPAPALPGATDHRKVEERKDVLVYTGPILKQPLTVLGSPIVELYASSDARDTDFTAKLLDVYPDGRAIKMNWTLGVIRARYRNGYEREELLTPNEPSKFRIELSAIGHVFQPGHRVRIEISSSEFPVHQSESEHGQSRGDGYRMAVGKSGDSSFEEVAFPSRASGPRKLSSSLAAAEPTRRPLLRTLGLGFALATVFNAAIGGGILRVPGAVAAELGNPWLILGMWAFGGLFAMLVANSYAELGTMLPKAGGPYVYARRAFGDYGGFLVGCVDWFINVAAMAFLSIAFGEFVVLLVPALAPRAGLIGPGVLVMLAMLHWAGVRAGSVAQQLSSVLKAGAFLLVIVACLAAGPTPANSFNSPVAHSPIGAFALGVVMVRAFQLVFETYDGWYAAVFFSEEDTNPGRNIPRALFGGILAVSGIYILLNLVLLLLLPLDTLATSKLPLADAARAAFGGAAGKVVTCVGLFSLLGILNCKTMYVPRTLFALSRDGLFAKGAARVNEGGTPDIAMAITLIVALLLAATGTFEELFAAVAVLSFVVDMSVHASLFKLRRGAPDAPRPYRAIAYPWFPGLALGASLCFMCAFAFANPASCLRALVPLMLSYPLYRLCAWRNTAAD